MAQRKLEPRFRERIASVAEHASRAAALTRGPKPKRRPTWPYALALLFAWAVLGSAALVAHWVSELPEIGNLLVSPPSQDVTLLDARGRLIARRGLVQGATVSATELPAYVPNAFIPIEDRRFREHVGVDAIGLARAALQDMAAGHVVQGGSTITQQLAKNLFLESHRTLDRKAHEALLALYLERRYSKDQILTLYLNRVYFGAGVFGIDAACGSASALNLAGAFTLPANMAASGKVSETAGFPKNRSAAASMPNTPAPKYTRLR